ncbi:hypothetical protein [Crateriforma spongiae]|uniref:hypothetical protein n=1 Tax=Crateriforma spongiae TaxID=2724528 RepID=UPI0014466AA9|nr:hypothetical protein [Crateriforma spongiae]
MKSNRVETGGRPVDRWRGSVTASLIFLACGCVAAIADGQSNNAPNVVNSRFPISAAPASNQRFQRIRLPRAANTALGFSVVVTIPEFNEAGYLPVHVTLRSPRAFPADRSFVLRLEQQPADVIPATNLVQIDIPIRVAERSQFVNVHHAVPRYTWNRPMTVTLMESGMPIPGCQATLTGPVNGQSQMIREATSRERLVRPLWISSTASAPNNQWIESSPYVIDDLDPDSTRGRLMRLLAMRSRMPLDRWGWTRIDAAMAFADWRIYNRFSCVTLSDATLGTLAKDRIDRITPLSDWVLSGGALVVLDSPSVQQTLSTLGLGDGRVAERDPPSVDWTPVNAAKSAAQQMLEPSIENWVLLTDGLPPQADAMQTDSQMNPASYGQYTETINPMVPMAGFEEFGGRALPVLDKQGRRIRLPADVRDAVIALQSDIDADRQLFRQSGDTKWFRVGAGELVVIPDKRRPYSAIDLSWPVVQAQLATLDHVPIVRRGVDPLIGDQRYFRWLIPGVSQPPVYAFIGFLSVFVICVGPLSYYWTSKTGRLHLMYAIAPVLALGTTGALLAYGVISDGFDVTARARQITVVDGVTGHATQRDRVTYFAGMQPSDDLKFLASDEVYPYRQGGQRTMHQIAQDSFRNVPTVLIDDQYQHFDSQFLPSRDQRQFVAQRVVRDLGKLSWVRPPGPEIRPVLEVLETVQQQLDPMSDNSSDEGESQPDVQPAEPMPASPPPVLSNGLPWKLQNLVIRGDDNRYWYVPVVKAGEEIELRQLKDSEIGKALGMVFRQQRLSGSYEMVDWSRSSSTYGRTATRYRDLIYDVIQSGVFGRADLTRYQDGALERELQEQLLFQSALQPNQFVGLAPITRSAIALDDVEVVESIHFVMGTLP